jgi:flavin reductase (DIM6/NTAB) family NADH-FMN oxidoreductase RutF
MKILSENLNRASAYKLLTGVVVPRPIAWISTVSTGGASNLAPFSCFTFVSTDPPMIGFNCGLRDGQRKDTARNILETREFVVNVVDEPLLDQMHQSAADYPPDISEMELLRVPCVASDLVSPLRIASSPVSMECHLDQVVSFGISGSEFFVGEIKIFHIRDGLLSNGKVDSEELRPVARLGGPVYGKIGEVLRLQRSIC